MRPPVGRLVFKTRRGRQAVPGGFDSHSLPPRFPAPIRPIPPGDSTMALLRGCEFPDTLLYHPDSHLWFAPAGDGIYRVGVTRFGIALSGEILLFTPKPVGARCDAGRSFGLLATGFILLFGVVVALLALDQARVMEHAQRLQEQTVPEILRFQSLARNLEQMRQEGFVDKAINSYLQ